MQLHDDIVHSEAFQGIMRSFHRQKRRRILRNIMLYTISAIIIAGIMVLFCCSMAYEQTPEPKTERITVEPVAMLSYKEPVIVPFTEIEPVSESWNEEEAYLLAKIAMAEAEGEDTEGKALVILTVLNRVQSEIAYFPDTISEVIYQEWQFTPVANGRFDIVEPDAECWEALSLVESGWDESHGALYFERTTNKSTWHSRNLKKLFEHGSHTFYTEVDAE